MTDADIAFAASSVVGIALIAISGACVPLFKRLRGNSSLAYVGTAGALLFPLLTGIALMSPLLTSTMTQVLPNLPFPGGLSGQSLLLLAAFTAPLAVISIFALVQSLSGMPSTADLEAKAMAHRRTLEKLRDTRKDLERRVAERSREVYEAKRRLELALRDTAITIAMQDTLLRYIWIRNAPAGFDAQDMLGRTDAEILEKGTAKEMTSLKQKVLDTGEEVKGQIFVRDGRGSRYFDLRAEPYHNEDGTIAGVLSIAVDVTEQREREERLRSVLLEMSHRSKNTLAILLVIARQTARRSRDVADFITAFDARLRALLGSQDLLVEHDWRSIPLHELLRAQIAPYLGSSEKRLQLEGPDVRIRAEPAQNLGLVLHELARNARRFGALSNGQGQIRVMWDLEPAEAPTLLRMKWEESGGPKVIAPTSPPGFGQQMTEQILARSLDGRAFIDYRPEGIVCKIDVSAANIEM